MAETKYGKYFYQWDPEKDTIPVPPGLDLEMPTFIAKLDDNRMKGSNFYLVHWMLPGQNTFPDQPWEGHPIHMHKDAELLFHIGTNPDDPMDLGAEVVMYMGPEMERHVITKSTVIFIPPKFIHCPWIPVRTDRPWIFIEVNQGPFMTSKSMVHILPKDIQEKVLNAKFAPVLKAAEYGTDEF